MDCFKAEVRAAQRELRKSRPSKKERAVNYASGLTTAQLIKKLKGDGFDHPGRLARSLGLPDEGTRWKVASGISKKYGPKK